MVNFGRCRFVIFVVLVFCAGLLASSGCGKGGAKTAAQKVIVVGFDGLDPDLVRQYMAQGRMPNFAKLAEQGDFRPLGTSVPPQSPVAWSNFITGMNPGGHGIYDFIHRDPEHMAPVSSTSRTEGSSKSIRFGKWVLPLAGGKIHNLRQGDAFWVMLEKSGIPTTIFRVPANFPPVEYDGKSLSGMGTPDILGSFGTFSFYTDDPPPNRDDISGGVVYPVEVAGNAFEAKLVGPKNAFLKDQPDATIPFKVWLDPEHPTAKIEVRGKQFLLKEKEWSDWVQVDFEMIPYVTGVKGICRFYLKEVRPNVKLYVSPINIDPSEPAMPISTPEDWSKELHHDCGDFYTKGMPEETKALSWGVFDYSDYLVQSNHVMDESIRLFDYLFDKFNEGLLFFYFGTTDLNAHMFYSMIDPQHPGYDAEKAKQFGGALPSLYQTVDGVVGKIMQRLDDKTTLLIISDHGFAPFRRAFHLNTWLKNEGYITLVDESKQAESEYFSNVDWMRTRAYGLGFNGLYLNLRGREANGIVSKRERDALLNEISQKLLALRDPKNGERIVHRVDRAEEVYSGRNIEFAPDLIVGYARGYRASWETTIGNFPLKIIEDNLDPWSGDHLMAAELVPGVILTNKKIKAENPKLYDIAPTILSLYGVEKNDEMVGNSIF